MSLIELDNVTKGFFLDRGKSRASVAVDGVSLGIDEGEFVSLIGPSGCGKTVTLSLIAGFARPTSGEVRFAGAPVAKPGPERGVVFQEYSLLPWLTVEQNILFALKSGARRRKERFDREQARTQSRDALSSVGLAHVADWRPNTLSGGMKQRVAIARLLALDSDVFLMDEPFSALDEQTRASLDRNLYELWHQRRKTVVFVTHNISEAVLVSSRVVLFSASPGRIVGEWRIPESIERAPESPELARIGAEIRAQLPTAHE